MTPHTTETNGTDRTAPRSEPTRTALAPATTVAAGRDDPTGSTDHGDSVRSRPAPEARG